MGIDEFVTFFPVARLSAILRMPPRSRRDFMHVRIAFAHDLLDTATQ